MIRGKPNRRKYKRRLTIPLMLVMMILLAFITSASISAFEWLRGVFNSHILTLKGITVQGNRRVGSANILDATGLCVGIDNIYSIMPHIMEKRIKARFRYLERVEIQRRMDGWVTVAVKEREPFAIIDSGRDDDSFMVVDVHGFILEEVGAGFNPACKFSYGDMPVIAGVVRRETGDVRPETRDLRSETGVSSPESEVSSLKSQVSGLALDVLESAFSLVPGLFGEISDIDARDPDDIILHLRTLNKSMPGMTIRIASDQIEEGLINVQHVIMKLREENRETKYMDARFPGAIYCKADK